jgi:ABC-type multidrug transport system permease subunit
MRIKLIKRIQDRNHLAFQIIILILGFTLFIIIFLALFSCIALINHDQWFENLGILMAVGISNGFSWIFYIAAPLKLLGEKSLLFLSLICKFLKNFRLLE